MAVHLTPTELADELQMKRRDVISKCMEMHVPIFHGRIDKTLFVSSMRRITARQAAGRRLDGSPLHIDSPAGGMAACQL